MGLSARRKCRKGSTERRTNILLFLVFSLDLLTIEKNIEQHQTYLLNQRFRFISISSGTSKIRTFPFAKNQSHACTNLLPWLL